MSALDYRRDGFVLLLLVVMVLLLGFALTGWYRAFAYALAALVGLLMALGFVRQGDAATWAPPLLATAVLVVAFGGMFANERAVVGGVDDTVLGFQAGTAFLIYGIWIPAFFTMGLSFTLLFDRLTPDDRSPSARSGSEP